MRCDELRSRRADAATATATAPAKTRDTSRVGEQFKTSEARAGEGQRAGETSPYNTFPSAREAARRSRLHGQAEPPRGARSDVLQARIPGRPTA